MSTVLSEVTHDRMLSPRQVAEVLGVHRDTVYDLLNDGEIPCRMVGKQKRVWFSDLRSWVDSQ